MNFEEDIVNALKTLREGGVILYPTDTVWGLGCDATNDEAVEKIFRIKLRNDSKSLIILVDSEAMLERYVKDIPEIALELIEVSDTPITIIYPNAKNLASAVQAEDGSVGIRVCMDKFCNELIGRFRKPIVSTSANISGEPSPANFMEIQDKIIRAVDYTVEHKREDRQKHAPSPILKIEHNGVFKIIRK
ncbi:MAG: threonylcarbamoyl-AMP synthase [Odoribacter sp.]|nr:threonylcarbamoyl-AMP synthase [Odoribacter sp.]